MGCLYNKELEEQTTNLQKNPRKNMNDNSIDPFGDDNDKSTPSGNSNHIENKKIPLAPLGMTEYDEDFLESLNKIRQNPQGFIKIIEAEKSRVVKWDNRLIYENKIKIELNRGIEAFDEGIKCLREMSTMGPLKYNEGIVVQCPCVVEKMRNDQHLVEGVKNKSNIKIDYYYRELARDPDIALLLAICGANEDNNKGEKRKALLNPKYKSIGLSSVIFRKTFCAYITLS